MVKNFPNLMKQDSTSKKLNKLKQNKLKEIHTEMHYNQITRRQRENLKNRKREDWQPMPHLKTVRPEGSRMPYLKCIKNCPSRSLYPAKMSFKNEGVIKTYPNKWMLKELITSRSALQEIVIQAELKGY